MLSDFGIDEGAQVILELGVRSLFVDAGQAAVTSDIGRQDSCEPSLYSLGGQGGAPLFTRSKQLPVSRQPFELVRSPVRKLQSGPSYKVHHHSRYEHFPGLRERHYPSCSMNRDTANVCVPFFDLACMKARPQ